MSEEFKDIDELFKKGLEHYAPEPAADTWQKIQQQKRQEKPVAAWWKSPGKLVLLTGALLLIIATVFFTTPIATAPNKAPISNAPSAKPATNTPTSNDGLQKENTSVQNFKSAQNAAGKEAANAVAIPQKNDKLLRSYQPAADNKADGSVKKYGGKTAIDVNTAGQTDWANNIKQGAAKTNKKQPGFYTTAPQTNGAAAEYNPETGAWLLPDATAGNVKSKKAVDKKKGQQQANSVEIMTANNGRDNAVDLQSPLQRQILGATIITARSLKEAPTALPQLNRPPDCPVAERDAAANKLYWEIYTSADVAFKKFADTANSLLLQKRKASTSFVSAFSFGARITRVFNNGISIRAGINYSQINERFSFVQSNIVQTTFVLDPNTGDTIGFSTVTGSRFKTTYNRYRFIDVPLLIGYEMGNGRFHANISAGPVINLYSWQKGEQLDTAFRPVVITTGKGNPLFQYKTNTGIGFTGAASLWYKLNERMHLLAEPYFRYSFAPINKEGLSLQERFNTIGLRLGVRFDIQ
jgi:hypothetical protein